jgi:acetyl esterase/lipase
MKKLTLKAIVLSVLCSSLSLNAQTTNAPTNVAPPVPSADADPAATPAKANGMPVWKITEVHPTGPVDFVAPAWMTKDKPDLAAAIQKVGVKVFTDQQYVENGGKQRSLDIYIPQNSGGKKMPVIVFFHGSPSAGDKGNWVPALLMLPRGYVVISANYRLVPTLFKQHLAFPENLYDAKAAIRWVRAHAADYNINPDRLAVWGHSWGGYLVDLLGTTDGMKQFEGAEGNLDFSSHVNAVISWSGPGDYPALYQNFIEVTKKLHPEKDPAQGSLAQNIGGPGVASPEKAAEASPKTYIHAGQPPFLVMAGGIDTVVPPAIAQQPFADAMKAAGVDCTYVVVPGQGHGFGGPDVDKAVYDFLDKHLPPAK